MSVRVNLLPEEASKRQAASRQRVGLAMGVIGIVAVLAAVTFWQNGRVADAERRLADEREVLVALQADQQQLAEFADLESRVQLSDELILQALGGETSFAGVLQDVASVMPADAQLESMVITLNDPELLPADGAPATETLSIGTLVLVGQSLNDHAPGLERLLLELDKIVAFHDLFFTSSVQEQPGIPYPTFTVEAQLGPEILTGRYIDGVPEGLR